MQRFLQNIQVFILSHKKLVIAAVVVIIVIFVGLRIFGPKNSAPQYQTASVTRGTLITNVSTSGSVSVANKVSVTTQASGAIDQVFVKNGDTVTAGENIATVKLDQNGQQKQASAWSSYLSAQNSLAAAQAKINSLQSSLFVANQAFVNDRGVSNPTDDQKADPKYIEEDATWLQAEADYKNQTNVIAQTQSALNSASLSYQAVSSTITAPITGTITDLTLTPGMQISGSSGNSNSTTTTTDSGQAIASIKTGGTPIVSVNISEVDVTKVAVGQKATITFDALPNQTFTGKIIGINTTGSVSSGVTTYPATIALDTASDKIFPNMSATVSIITNVKDNVILVPTAAVQSGANGSTVRVMKNGQMSTVAVTVGDSSDTQTEIISGLSEGDTVVTSVVSTNATRASNSSTSPFSAGGLGGGRGFGGGGGAVFFRAGGGGGARGG